jgi:hypothetical protein
MRQCLYSNILASELKTYLDTVDFFFMPHHDRQPRPAACNADDEPPPDDDNMKHLGASRSRGYCLVLYTFTPHFLVVYSTPFIKKMTKQSKSQNIQTSTIPAKNEKQRPCRRRRREVQVVTCPLDFPTAVKKRNDASFPRATRHSPEDTPKSSQQEQEQQELLDWNDTCREMKQLVASSSAFSKQTKRQYQQEEYQRLTGRHHMKQQQYVPQDIVRGIKKKAKARLEKQQEEATLHGIVLPPSMHPKQTRDKSNKRNYHSGPAPSIGYMKRGVYRVNNHNHNKKKKNEGNKRQRK